MNLYNLISEANATMEEWLMEHATVTSAEAIGLDQRAGYRLWATTEAVIVKASNDRSLQHFGGFEYVDAEYRKQIGDYVIYSQDEDEECRVDECIQRLFYPEKET